MKILLLALLAHNTLTWDKPYPPPGFPEAQGVRCYVQQGGVWDVYEQVGTDGYCHPIRELTVPTGSTVRFCVRGWNEAGESGDSNVLELTWPQVCEFSTRAELLACMGVN